MAVTRVSSLGACRHSRSCRGPADEQRTTALGDQAHWEREAGDETTMILDLTPTDETLPISDSLRRQPEVDDLVGAFFSEAKATAVAQNARKLTRSPQNTSFH